MAQAGRDLLHVGHSVLCTMKSGQLRSVPLQTLFTHLNSKRAQNSSVSAVQRWRLSCWCNVGGAKLAPHHHLRWSCLLKRLVDLNRLVMPSRHPRLLHRHPGSSSLSTVEYCSRSVELQAIQCATIGLDPSLHSAIGANDAREDERDGESDGLDVSGAVEEVG